MATIRKREKSIWKIKDMQDNLFEDHEEISQAITKEFQKKLKVDLSINLMLTIHLSSDITEADNEFLINEVRDDEIFDNVNKSIP